MKVAVLYGGVSPEREISLRSGTAVANALHTAGHSVELYDTRTQHVERLTCDVAFVALHGSGGEDGQLQMQLETLGITYTGSGPAASRLCFDKWQYRQALQSKVRMPEGYRVDYATYQTHPLQTWPHVLKPINGGSSIDTFIVRQVDAAPLAEIEQTFGRHGTLLLEQLIEGVELTVGVLGTTALPVIEIVPPAQGEFDYHNKYNGRTQELCPPQHIDTTTQAAAQALALKAHTATDCRDLSRTDMIVTPNDAIYVLETNTIPGMTDCSLFPTMAATAGISMPALTDRLVHMAWGRRTAAA